jgi:hypothetical protein
VLLLVVNFLISIFNSWSVGRSWVETKAAGGFARLMSWMGATMASVGFTWCYLVVIAYIASATGKLPPKYIDGMLSIGYLAIIVPLIGSGIAITVDSWMYFWRRRTFGSGALATWNTAADVYNIYEAASAVPTAWDTVKDVFSSSDDDDNGFGLLAIMLAVAALLGGILTAAAIIRIVAESTAIARKRSVVAYLNCR